MKAPQSETLNKLRAEDPTLNGRIKQAFAAARRNGHERYAFVELQDDRILVVEKLNSSQSSFTKGDDSTGNSSGKSYKSVFAKIISFFPF